MTNGEPTHGRANIYAGAERYPDNRCMVEVQLPVVLLWWDGTDFRQAYVDALAAEFEVRLVRDREELESMLGAEVEVLVVPVEAVDDSPSALATELGPEGQFVPMGALVPPELSRDAVPTRVQPLRLPVEPAELVRFVRRVRRRTRYQATVDRYYELAAAVAEREVEAEETGDEALAEQLGPVKEKMDALSANLVETQESLEPEDIRALFREF